jgi:hypothetical protein
MDAVRNEVERSITLQGQGTARMMCKHEGRSVIRGIVAPPPLPSVVGPGAAYGSKHVSPDDPRADVVEATRDEVIVNAR